LLSASRRFLVTAAGAPGSPLQAHFWHAVEAVGFLITALGGIALAEFVGASQRRRARANLVSAPVRELLTVGGSSSVGLLEARTVAVADPPVRTRQFLLPLVALAGAGAAAVHFVVMPEHFEEATLYGGFFAAAATSQLLYCTLLLIRPSRPLVVAGALGNLAIIVLWVITRTAGIPLGPGAGTTESVGGLDILATGFEVVTTIGAIALLCRWVPPHRAIRTATWSRLILVLAPAAAIAIGVTTYLSPPS